MYGAGVLFLPRETQMGLWMNMDRQRVLGSLPVMIGIGASMAGDEMPIEFWQTILGDEKQALLTIATIKQQKRSAQLDAKNG